MHPFKVTKQTAGAAHARRALAKVAYFTIIEKDAMFLSAILARVYIGTFVHSRGFAAC